MKSEKETIYDYAAELKLLSFKEELECTLSLAAEENWNHLQFLTELLGKESARRRECRRRSRIRSAGFPQMKYNAQALHGFHNRGIINIHDDTSIIKDIKGLEDYGRECFLQTR